MSSRRFQWCLTVVLVYSISLFSSNLLNILPLIFFLYFSFHTLILFFHLKFFFSPPLLLICLLPFIPTVYYPHSNPLLPLLMFFFHPLFYAFSTLPLFLIYFFSFITLSYFFYSTSSSSNCLPFYFSHNLSVGHAAGGAVG